MAAIVEIFVKFDSDLKGLNFRKEATSNPCENTGVSDCRLAARSMPRTEMSAILVVVVLRLMYRTIYARFSPLSGVGFWDCWQNAQSTTIFLLLSDLYDLIQTCVKREHTRQQLNLP